MHVRLVETLQPHSTRPGRRETVAFVIPLYNEEEVLPVLIREVEAYRAAHPEVTEVVLVDDGSTDGTASLIRSLTEGRPGYVLLRFSRNFGHQLAITAGMHCVSADAAVVLDGDLQDPLDVVTQMIEKWRQGFDVVYGIRRERHGDGLLKRWTARLFYRLFQHLTDVDAPLDAGDFRLVSRPVLDAYRQIEEHQPYVRGLIAWLGFNQTGVFYDRPPRAAGRSKYPLRRSLRLAFDGIASFSVRPLRYAVRLGLLVAALSVIGLVWVLLAKYAFGNTIPGWSSLIFAAFFFGGLQLFFLGVVGSYLARVYEEVKARPRYVVRERWVSEPAEASPAAGREPETARVRS
ncbi:glycosyltransferase family 2 protein [Rhodocaloribacter litoris]|uniref:glycosyltransferase family 2 protein n=1 Tax=Rhodocaloribacter litoris TaxID=2558931 RepID=UPI001E46790B|nr:glycosyltransferase family 2 protein [Rhodocaloribacter litoris]QXD15269.1 glycosyltransferase family 2 protein [Rhodocaloribacter litoris]